MSFKLKALVCDDSSVMRKILTEILEAENFQVVAEAPDGIEAVRLCKLHTPNLVTLDIAMPGMDGISALKEIRKISKEIKVVMVTSLDRQELVLEALKNGAENYITKPYQAEKVARVIACINY
ncbi:MAG: response regulator [Candidatus Wallbacteria bacterium]|nr:response regulator [Candidatus Wallbacteria bacterium]